MRIWHVALLLVPTRCEVTTIPLPRDLQCPPSQVFDFAGLRCAECDPGLEPEGALACRCPSDSLQIQGNCDPEATWQGTCQDIECEPCGVLLHVASTDQNFCMPCNIGPPSEESSEYDPTINDCACKQSHAHKLVEVYDSEGVPVRKDCVQCPKGTAVITEDLYEDGQRFYVTGGRKYTADPYSCQSCPDPHMIFGPDRACGCADGYILTGEASVGEQSCLRRNPSLLGSFSRVRFRDPFAPRDFSLDSMLFAHVYPKAAAECEYFEGSSRKSLTSCQALSNLCVLSSYDEDSVACQQLETISQRRTETYRNQEDWTYTLPWLYYSDEKEYITNDRGINMEMSFRAKVNRVNILSFKLAKYTVNGTFVGMEDLTNQFEFCLDSSGKDDRNRWTFGRYYRNEYLCSFDSLLTKDMFLYDLYLIDESSESCDHDLVRHECLYPVPVLNRNLVKENKFVNIENDLDDIYTRRFYLVDNQSGRTSSGTEAVRYAKKIVLEIQTQSENPDKLYPPRLVIEYETIADGRWSIANEGTLVKLLFKIEYSMKTEKFWSNMQPVIGFTIAVAVVMLSLELNNWVSRQRLDSNDLRLTGAFVFNAVMVACHIFAVLFSVLSLLVAMYFFLFFKLQSQVFLLLPSDNEFRGMSNEYYVLRCLFHALFWCQTVYLVSVIAQQCRSDIIFVDWEHSRRRSKSNGVPSDKIPMWRLVTVANEFNRMGAKRKSSTEFSLIAVAFFMIGLNQHKNGYPQPNFHHSEVDESQSNIVLSFSNTVLIWVAVWIAQMLWKFFFYERVIEEQESTKFVDLCTVCNISVFIMVENNKGYYLHCKSPYQSAECTMEELLDNLKREGRGLTIERGLDGSPGCQTFNLFVSNVFRNQISKIYNYAGPSRGHYFSHSRNNKDQEEPNQTEDKSFARVELNRFLQSFIDQQPTPARDGLRYIVRKPWLAERLLNVTPAEFRSNVESKCILCPDDKSFLRSTFLGIELDLVIHDILTYNVASMTFDNAGISIFLTYLMHLLRTFLRVWFGKKNISNKSFIDPKLFG